MSRRRAPPQALERRAPDHALRDALAHQEAIAAKVERARAELLALDAEVREAMAAVVGRSQAKLHEIAALDRLSTRAGPASPLTIRNPGFRFVRPA